MLSALAIVAMMSLLMSGVCLLAESHEARQKDEADYSLAMQMAEAGINYELNYASNGNTPAAHLSSSPYTGSVPGATGSFTVYVTNQDGTTNWVSGNPMTVVSTGTVGGVTRKVSVNATGGGGTSIFNNTYGDSGGYLGGFALFGYSKVQFTTASSAVNGDLGTNGTITVNNNGNGSINGSCYLEGASASESNVTVHNILHGSSAIAFPTIDTIVASQFANGWSTLESTANVAAQSARLRTYASNSPVNTVAGTKYIGWTNKTSISNSDMNSLNCNTLIFPPGDYYFTDMTVNGSNYTIIFDTAAVTVPGGTPGPVRIWMANSTNSDTWNCTATFTKSNDCSQFRVFYDKPATLTLTGNQPWYGGIYGVRAGSSTTTTAASFNLGSNTKVTGYVIGDNVLLTGGTVLTQAGSYPLVSSEDYLMGGSSQYGMTGQWKELAATSGSVFVDGTNN